MSEDVYHISAELSVVANYSPIQGKIAILTSVCNINFITTSTAISFIVAIIEEGVFMCLMFKGVRNSKTSKGDTLFMHFKKVESAAVKLAKKTFENATWKQNN